MDFPTLKNLITTALGSTPFSISGAALSSTGITTLFTNQFGSDSLVLASASQQSVTDSSIAVQGSLTTSFLGASNLSAVATFTVVSSMAEVAIVVTGLPDGWALSTAFSSLKSSLFDAFSYSSPQFTLDSQNSTVLPAAFPSTYGIPGYASDLEAALLPGLSFQATVTVIAGLTGIGWLLSGDQWTVSGPIELYQGLPSILLTSPAGDAISIGNYSVAFEMSLVAGLIQPPEGATPVAVTCCLQVEADIDIALSTSTLTIPVYARTFTQDITLLSIESNLSQLSNLVFDDITTLIAGGSTAGQIPSVFPALNDIGLQSISLTIAPATQSLVSASATIAFQPGQGDSWSILNGLIEFNGMAVTLTYVPAASSVQTDVTCSATIAQGTLDAGVSLPEMYFFCALQAGTAIDISSIVTQATGGTVDMPTVSCTELKFFGYVSESQYRFQATVSDNWTFTIPGSTTQLAITQVGMDLTYATGAGLSGEIIGTLTVAGVPLFASAEYDTVSNGWIFSGGTQGPQTIQLNAVVDDALSLFGLALPSSFPVVDLLNLNVTFNTGTNAFALLGAASVTVAGVTCDLGAQISTDTGSTIFNGYLWIGDNAFELDFSKGSSTVVAGSWVSTDASPALSLNAIVQALDLPLPALPDSIDLTLTSAEIIYDITNNVVIAIADTASYGSLLFVVKGAAGTESALFGISIDVEVDFNLSNLPMVGAELAKIETIKIDDLQLAASNQPLGTAGAQLNTLVTTYTSFIPSTIKYVPFPTPGPGATTQVLFTAAFDFGSGKLPISIPLDGGSLSDVRTPGPRASTSDSSGGVTWFNLQKSFGPICIQKVGVLYQSASQSLWFELDATLAFGPFSLSLQGLGLGSPLTTFEPMFSLQGFGVAYNSPPIQVSGALVNLEPPGSKSVQLEGELVIGAEDFTVQVLGYYGNNLGFPSFFIFGDLAYDFGGPPAFFVTGVALGFGYNSNLTLPTINQVATFPFIEVLPTSTYSQPDIFGGSTSPLTVLGEIIPTWVNETKGSLWVAAGITFTSFELVNSQAMIIVEAGSELVIALLGTSSAQFPQGGGDTLYANIDLELEARFAPSEGVFSIQALLSPSSFVLDKACTLTGGFAFFVWYGPSPYAGDFVVTLGGYNPGFTPPDYYPVVPEVGFHWTLDSSVSIQGGAYFALTPAVLMVGGELDATYQSGNLKAWFNAHADAIIRWKPFFMDVNIGVTIGASYVLDLAGASKTVSVELGCSLEFWGPPTGGTVSVSWYIISFTIQFGAQNSQGQSIKGWSDVAAMLPNTGTTDAPQILSLTPTSGLTSSGSSSGNQARAVGDDPSFAWTVRGSTFGFTTASPAPASTVTIGNTTPFTGSAFEVYPLQWTGVTAEHKVTITDSNQNDYSTAFEVTQTLGNVPASLWGSPPQDGNGNPQVPSGAEQLVPGQITGLSLNVIPPTTGNTAGPINVQQELDYDNLNLGGAVMPLSGSASPTGDIAVNSQTTIAVIADATSGIGSTAANAARDAILHALSAVSYGPETANDPMTEFASEIGGALNAEPLLVP